LPICGTITSQLELYLGRTIFHEFRSHVRAPSRKKTLPSTLSAKVSVGDQEFTHEFLAGDQPFVLMLPIWDLPGIIRGDQPQPDLPVCNVRAYNFMTSTLRETLGLPDDAPSPLVRIASGKINNITFAGDCENCLLSCCRKIRTKRVPGLGHTGYHPWQIFLCSVFRRERPRHATTA
jgi:hypothetical protein